MIVFIGLTSIVLAWILVHMNFALRYAFLYYYAHDGGIKFDDTDKKPIFSDFLYFAFTIGMTYQVSDSQVTNQKIRSTVLRHALLSFLFGTTIIAVSINFIASVFQ